MGRVAAGDVGVVIVEIGADQVAVHSLEEVVRLSVVRVDDEVEVAGAHVERPQPGPDDGVRAGDAVGDEHGRPLSLVGAHDLEPADEPPRSGVPDDVRAIDHLRRMQRRVRVVLVRRDDHSAVGPVREVGRRVAADAPMPDPVAGPGAFLVLAVPVEDAVDLEHRAAVRLDGVCRRCRSRRLPARSIALSSQLPRVRPIRS